MYSRCVSKHICSDNNTMTYVKLIPIATGNTLLCGGEDTTVHIIKILKKCL